MQAPDEPKRHRRITIALAVLIATVMVALGVWSILDAHHVGSTKRGAVVSLDGDAARWMGAMQICVGMLPLMLAMPSKKVVLRWALVWIALAAACFVMALRSR